MLKFEKEEKGRGFHLKQIGKLSSVAASFCDGLSPTAAHFWQPYLKGNMTAARITPKTKL